jgi:hypothetical protein
VGRWGVREEGGFGLRLGEEDWECVLWGWVGVMVRNRPAGDAFASNRRSPALLRRKRELELKAAQDGEEFGNGEGKPGSLRSSTARLTSFFLISLLSRQSCCGAVVSGIFLCGPKPMDFFSFLDSLGCFCNEAQFWKDFYFILNKNKK